MVVVHINASLGNEEKSWSQILAILTASVSCLLSGLLFAWPSPFLTKIVQDKQTYNITENQASYFTVINMIGVIVFSPILIPVAKIYGRKWILLSTSLPFTVALVIKAFATNLWLLYFARLCCGLGDALIFTAFPAYVGEISSPKIRGIWGNSFACVTFLGYFMINVIGSQVSIQQTSFISLGFVALFLVTFPFMPESPYFLIMKNRDMEAKENLKWLRRMHDVENEFSAIKTAVEQQLAEAGSWKNLFSLKANKKALIAGIFLRTSQQFSGVSVFMSYTKFIFEKAGTFIKSSDATLIYTAITFLCYVCSCYVSNLLGRPKAYIISMCLSSILLLAESCYFLIDQKYPAIDLDPIKWFPLVGMVILVAVSSFGVGIVPTLMLSELFSTGIKPQAMCVMSVAFGLNIFIVNIIFYQINSITGLFGPFLLFGICDIVSAILANYIVPETTGKTLEEIQSHLKM